MPFRPDLDSLILSVLEEGGAHGYIIAKRIHSRSEAALSVGEGQLYPALHALEAGGLITADWEQQEGKPPRKIYSLTSSGQATLAEKRSDWSQFVSRVNEVMKPGRSLRAREAGHG